VSSAGSRRPEPRVAVIVPCFNDGSFVREALESVAEEEAVELVVIDDASTDPATAAVLDGLSRDGVRVVRHEGNQGLSAARMTGLRATSAPFVFPLDSDDLVARGALSVLADVLESNPAAAAAFANYEEFGARSRIVAVPARLDAFRIAYRNEYPVSSMFRREALERAGGWRDVAGLVGYEDWNLWMTLAERGEQGIRAGPDIVALRRRIHGSRMLADAGRRHRELYGHLRRLHPDLFADIAAHRSRTDLTWGARLLYPALYGARPPLGIWSRVQALRRA
jgi:glycosyltransferase involved in cell wall biosynthesis